MKTLRSSETSVKEQTAQSHVQEDSTFHSHRFDNFKSNRTNCILTRILNSMNNLK
jgi:hypothetical protein